MIVFVEAQTAYAVEKAFCNNNDWNFIYISGWVKLFDMIKCYYLWNEIKIDTNWNDVQ